MTREPDVQERSSPIVLAVVLLAAVAGVLAVAARQVRWGLLFRSPASQLGEGAPHEDRVLLAAGRVFDERGTPLSDAAVTALSGIDPGPLRDLEGPLVTWSGPDGAFELLARPLPPGGMRAGDEPLLLATRPGHFSSRALSFRPGSLNMTLVLPRAGRVEGRLEVPAGVAPSELVLRLVALAPQPARLDLPPQVETLPDDTGGFRFATVPPGPARLEVHVPGAARGTNPCAALELPEVAAAGTTRDPGLEGLPVQVFASDLSVLERDGAPLAGGVVRAHAIGPPDAGLVEVPIVRGRARLLTPWRRFRLSVDPDRGPAGELGIVEAGPRELRL